MDRLVLTGTRAEYAVLANADGTWQVNDIKGRDGQALISNVERLFFADTQLGLDLTPQGHLGQAVLLVGAVLGGELARSKKALVGVVAGLLEQGLQMEALAAAVMRLPIWAGVLTPTDSAADKAAHLLRVVMRREPTVDELAAAVAKMGLESAGAFLASLARSEPNLTQVDLVGLSAVGFELPLN